jgi:hypothetical protein
MNWIGTPDYKIVLAVLATVLTVVAFVPYLRSIQRGHTRPHVFSWIIWGINTGIAFLAVLAERGGAGAWPIGFSCVVTLFVAALAYIKRADVSITRADWLFFIAALAAIPVWWMADDPLWAVVLITVIELLGFGPTFRKCWHQPHSESMTFLAILIARNVLIVAALERHLLTTLLFPVAMAAACGLLITIMLWRRPHVALE